MDKYMIEVIGGLAVILASVLGSYFASRATLARVEAQNKLDRASTDNVTVEAMNLVIIPLKNELQKTQEEVKILRTAIKTIGGPYQIAFRFEPGEFPTAVIEDVWKVNGDREKENGKN